MELQGDVSIEAEAEVVVEHVQRQLRTQENINAADHYSVDVRAIIECNSLLVR